MNKIRRGDKMKKLFSLFILFLLLFSSLPYAVLATESNKQNGSEPSLPSSHGNNTQGDAGTITFIFQSGDVGTKVVLQSKTETDDERIEQALKGLRVNQEIKQITHVDGIPIEKTKWAKYGGIIKHTKSSTTTVKPHYEDKIRVIVNQEPVFFADQVPVIKDGRTMVPMRAIFEHFLIQGKVSWDSKNKTVTATNALGKKVIFKLESKEYTIIEKDGKKKVVKTDVAPTVIKGRTMLPLRALGEALGLQVTWHSDTKVVELTVGGDYVKKLLPQDEWEARGKGGTS